MNVKTFALYSAGFWGRGTFTGSFYVTVRKGSPKVPRSSAEKLANVFTFIYWLLSFENYKCFYYFYSFQNSKVNIWMWRHLQVSPRNFGEYFVRALSSPWHFKASPFHFRASLWAFSSLRLPEAFCCERFFFSLWTRDFCCLQICVRIPFLLNWNESYKWTGKSLNSV